MPERSHRVGLIADTHGLLRPAAVAALRGVERIVHAGDVGAPGLLEQLEDVAPVTAVRGNVDHGRSGLALPATAQLEIGGVWFYVLHILEELDLDARAGGFDVVVSGHSHRPSIERRAGVLYVNPGSAGPRRFRLPVTLALVEIDDAGPRARIVELEPGVPVR